MMLVIEMMGGDGWLLFGVVALRGWHLNCDGNDGL